MSDTGNTLGKVVTVPEIPKKKAAEANPPVKPETKEEKGFFGKLWGGVKKGANWVKDNYHDVLDVVGMVPVVGEIADGANALLYLAEGDYANAAISAVALIPTGGQAATGSRLTVKAGKEIVEEVAERGAKEIVEEVAERGAKEVAEEVAERGAKEVAEEVAEKAAKEAAEEAAEKAAKETAEEAAEKAAKETAEEAAERGAKGDGGKVKGKGKSVDCKLIVADIYAKGAVLTKRIADLLEDKLNLFKIAKDKPHPSLPKGSGSWNGHIHQAKGYQTGLRNSIIAYDAAQCKTPKFPKHFRALAYAPLPSRPSSK